MSAIRQPDLIRIDLSLKATFRHMDRQNATFRIGHTPSRYHSFSLDPLSHSLQGFTRTSFLLSTSPSGASHMTCGFDIFRWIPTKTRSTNNVPYSNLSCSVDSESVDAVVQN